MRRAPSRKVLPAPHDEQREKMPVHERQHTLNRRLEKQVRFAYKSSAAIREILITAGITPSSIRTVGDLEKLPVTTREDVMEMQRSRPPFGGFLAIPLGRLDRVYVSPGPAYVVWGPERIRAAVRSFLRLGYPRFGDVALVSASYHMGPAGLGMTDALDMMGCTVVPAGTGQTELQVKLLHDLQATALLAPPSFSITILQKAEELGYDVRRDLNLKLVSGGGERQIRTLKRVFEEKYGLVVWDAYGTADLGQVAYSCGRADGYHYDDEACVVEIVDPDSGQQLGPHEVGQIVVTLFSGVYPLVRFGTGDLASYTDEPCPCGRSAPRITGIKGMAAQHVRVKGVFVHQGDLAEAMAPFPQVLKHQMLLTLDGYRDRAVLRIEVPEGIDRQALTLAVDRRCQDMLKLSFDSIELLPAGALCGSAERIADRRWGQT